MALIQEITSFLGNVLGTIADDKSDDVASQELTDSFLKQFGERVGGVSLLAERLDLPPVASAIVTKNIIERRRSRRKIRREEFEGDGFSGFDRLDNFFDFLKGLNEANLDRGRSHGFIFLNKKMLPMLVQQIEIDNIIQDPLDLGVDDPGEDLFLPIQVTQLLELPVGYEPSTIVVKGIIPNGPNTSPYMKLRALWRFYQSTDDLGETSAGFLTKHTGIFSQKSWDIWNPLINSSRIERVKLRRLNPADTVDHDAITINLTMRENIIGDFFAKTIEQSEPSRQERAVTRREELKLRIKALREDDDEVAEKAIRGQS